VLRSLNLRSWRRNWAVAVVELASFVLTAGFACSRSKHDERGTTTTAGAGGTSAISDKVLKTLRDKLPELDRQSLELRQRSSFWLVPHPMNFTPYGTAATSPIKLQDLGAYTRVPDQVVVRARVLNESDRPALPLVSFTFSDAGGRAIGKGDCQIERMVLRPQEWAACWASAPKDATSAHFAIDLSSQIGVERALEMRIDLRVSQAKLDSVLTPPGPGMPSEFSYSGKIAPARIPAPAMAKLDVEFYAGDVWVGHEAKTFSTERLADKGSEFSGSMPEINLLKAPTRVQATAFVLNLGAPTPQDDEWLQAPARPARR
jgi:hypothetical protein